MSPKPDRTRPARFKVPNNEKVIITIGTERYPGVLSVLSATGGALKITRRTDPGTFADIRMSTVGGSITAVIEFLAFRAGTQAFRFVQIDATNRKRLQSALDHMDSEGLGDRRTDPLNHVIRFARKLVTRKS